MAKTKPKYAAVKTTMWGVFRVGMAWSLFRSLVAAFADKVDAEKYARQYSADNFECKTMVEEIKVTIPAWDGTDKPKESR